MFHSPITHFSKEHDEKEFEAYDDHKKQIFLTESILESDTEYLDIKNQITKEKTPEYFTDTIMNPYLRRVKRHSENQRDMNLTI